MTQFYIKFSLTIAFLLVCCNPCMMAQNELYGINFTSSGISFAKADMTTGEISIVSDGAISTDGVVEGVADIDPVNGRYFYVRGGGDLTRIYTVDVETGTVLANPFVENPNESSVSFTNVAYDWINGTLYGLSPNYNGVDEMYLATVDPMTGAMDILSENPIAPGNYYGAGNADIDPIGQRYFFTSEDKIVTTDLTTGANLFNPVLNFPQGNGSSFLVNITYDWLNDVLYGLFFEGGPPSSLSLVSIDYTNGDINLISQSPISPDGFSNSVCDIDPINNRYFYIRSSILYIVDLTTGEATQEITLINPNNGFIPITSVAYPETQIIDACGNLVAPTDDNFNGCLDCNGVINGTAIVDSCGQCLEENDPDFNICIDCNGVVNGTAIFDDCGQCLDINDPNFDNCIDCNGIANGTAIIDSCGQCLDPIDPIFNNCINNVYPGDANYDGVVDTKDVVFLGIGYGLTGPPRPNNSIEWSPQFAETWNIGLFSFENTIDAKHSDCNGDGTINDGELAVIAQNYGATHNFGKTNDNNAGSPIWMELPDTLNPNDTVQIPIYIGNMDEPISDFYGISFSIEMDMDYLQENTISVDFQDNWLGTQNETFIALAMPLPTSDVIDIGITRINHENISGNGQIGMVSFVMIDDVLGKEDTEIPFEINITNIYALNNEGTLVEVSTIEEPTPTVIVETNTALASATNIKTQIYPNPTTGKLWIKTTAPMQSIKIINTQGKQVQKISSKNNIEEVINIVHLPKGIYFLEIQTQEGTITHKIQKN